MVSKKGTAASTDGKRTFAGQPMLGKVVGTVLAPVVLGGVSGLLLGPGLLGSAGRRGHRWFLRRLRAPPLATGVDPRRHGGLLYGAALFTVRALTGWTDTIDLGGVPGLLVVITALAGAVAGALGGAMRARR
ncbi:hypothetical protein [Amycolatopsis sp. NPDC051061]|uniref:hypothetical protein n=1 Tax=Amycolatopsis sp. NPDC051061 TaxID=3155042 RepID=UPI003444821D